MFSIFSIFPSPIPGRYEIKETRGGDTWTREKNYISFGKPEAGSKARRLIV